MAEGPGASREHRQSRQRRPRASDGSVLSRKVASRGSRHDGPEMRSRSPTAPSRQHPLPGFRRDHRSLGAAPRTPPEESCRSLRHPGRTVPHLGEGVRTPGKFRKFAEFRPGQADPGRHPVARVSRIQPARERHVATGLAATTAGAIGPTPAGRSVCTLSAGRPVLHEKQSACSALHMGRLPGTRRP